MKNLKPLVYANLYLFAPGVLIRLITPLFFNLLEPSFSRYANNDLAACDFTAGGGSINLCNTQILLYTLLPSAVIAIIISYFAVRALIQYLSIKWRSPFYGVALFLITPLILEILRSIFINFFPYVVAIFIATLAYFNFTSYRKAGSK